MSIRVLDGLTAVADQYDLFIIDQWGVLHDGVNPHEGAVEVLRALRKAGKTITILSNSSRRCSITVKHMSEMGFTSDLFDHCVTSGEEVWCALHDKKEPFYEALGERCFMFATFFFIYLVLNSDFIYVFSRKFGPFNLSSLSLQSGIWASPILP